LVDNLNPRVLYTYGLYVNSIAGNMKGISKREITSRYNRLPIKCRMDIVFDGEEISSLLGRKPGPYLKGIFKDLETQILSLELKNEKDDLMTYLKKMYL